MSKPHPGEFRPEATWPLSFLFLSLSFKGQLGPSSYHSQAMSLIWVSNAQTRECPKPATMKWTRDGGMEPFQFVAPPRGHAAIRPYRSHQPSPPLRPLDFSIEERDQPAAIDEPRQTMDPDVEEARRAHQLQGPSEGVMARYGVRVLPPRDHRRG